MHLFTEQATLVSICVTPSLSVNSYPLQYDRVLIEKIRDDGPSGTHYLLRKISKIKNFKNLTVKNLNFVQSINHNFRQI